MRKQEIEICGRYAVVGLNESGCEGSAFPGTVVAVGSYPGQWLIRFDEPMVASYGTLQRAKDARGKDSQRTFLERTFLSRNLLAPWDSFVVQRAQDERDEQEIKERNAQEEQQIEESLQAVAAALDAHGIDPTDLSFYTQVRGADGERRCWAQASISPEAAVFLAQVVQGLPVSVPVSALGSLISEAVE